MRPGQAFEYYTDWTGKAPALAARLACVLHGIKHAHGQPWGESISAETMKAALEILSVAAVHTLTAFNLMGADPVEVKTKLVWSWIENNQYSRFTIRDAFNALRSHFKRVAQLIEILDILEERGYLKIIKPQIDKPGRPPSPVVVVRPDIVRSW